jgi:hypothetical protein
MYQLTFYAGGKLRSITSPNLETLRVLRMLVIGNMPRLWLLRSGAAILLY